MWHDNETSVDYINFGFFAKTIAELISQSQQEPISIGVSGGWGSGKSSLIKMIEQELKEDQQQNKYVVVQFNPWLYQDFDDARLAFLQVVGDNLLREAKNRQTGLDKAKKIISRISIFGLLKTGAEAAVTLQTGVPVGAIGTAVSKTMKSLDDSGNSSSEAYDAVQKATSESNVIKTDDGFSLPTAIQDFRDSVEGLLLDLGVKLVVFVDDLDRCLPNTAVKTLEAMRLLLFLRNSAFVIAADDDVLRAAVAAQLTGAGIVDKMAVNYFDKLIQVPVRVPRIGVNEVSAYLALLFMEYALKLKDGKFDEDRFVQAKNIITRRLSETWSGKIIDVNFLCDLAHADDLNLRANLNLAVRLAPMMANSTSILGNPRLIKRFLNTVFLRSNLAKSQRINVDIPVLVKWHLLERCYPTFADKIASGINHDLEGRSIFLSTVKRSANDIDDASANIKEFFEVGDKDQIKFLEEWLKLEPLFNDIDLRPVLHLSRDSQIRDFGVDQLNQKGAELIEILNQAKVATDNYILSKIRDAGDRQAILAMERVWRRGSSSRTFSKSSELVPLVAVASVYPEAGGIAKNYLTESPIDQVGPVWAAALGKLPWAASLLDQWKSDARASASLKKAIDAAKLS